MRAQTTAVGSFIHPQNDDGQIFSEEAFASLPFPDDFPLDDDLDFSLSDIDLDFSVDDLLIPFADVDEHPSSEPGPPPPPVSGGTGSVVSSSSSPDQIPAIMDSYSPESGNSASFTQDPANAVKSEETATDSPALKRKKEREDGNPNPNPNQRNVRGRRTPTSSDEANSSSCVFNGGSTEEEKRRARLMRNRESAQLSRQRKKHHVEELEEKVRFLNTTIADLNNKMQYFMAENASLRQQLSSGKGGALPLPTAALYPPPPMHFPWIPCSAYALKPHGSQVPLVPIPRLKPQKPAPKVENKSKPDRGGFGSRDSKKDNGFGTPRNASEPLIASLYVPRNDKLVKIDGNLIIHSILASEKALASSREANGWKGDRPVTQGKESKETSLVVSGNVASALAVQKGVRDVERHSHMYKNDHPRALASSSGDTYTNNLKSSAAEGSLQQWFRQGLAGPLLSSGMCTEVFQFEVAPAPGTIIPATSIANSTDSSTRRPLKIKNRRFLYPAPIPLPGSTTNETDKPVRKPSEGSDFHGNKSSSSMVVSVLIDPREAGDGDSDGVLTPNSLSRIFVVVLLDSIKYVTYSCVLPFKTSGPLAA
ncbi:hypothetical protein QJS10_CPA16g01164 [Acorus calamus]|uniref:BZIP domain-containing protein n=1 Tax=Acorus calamus TaxID=4465 RepID=A0AAV9D4I9_ACOCL|nr:hypothetical protein QJS10_CPA16g01164 [Acorus calamus]